MILIRLGLIPALAAAVFALLSVRGLAGLIPGFAYGTGLFIVLQCGGACLIAKRLGAPWWWLVIHGAFLPLGFAAAHLHVPAYWWGIGFLSLLAVFWRTDRSRVPLYLSNRLTAQHLAQTIPEGSQRCIDLGCGTGSTLARLARLRPDCTFVGIEHAPIPYAIARLRTSHLRNTRILWGSFWTHNWGSYDWLYAFLSPAAMNQTAQQFDLQGKEHALLISNSFPIENRAPLKIEEVNDKRASQLFFYTKVKGVKIPLSN